VISFLAQILLMQNWKKKHLDVLRQLISVLENIGDFTSVNIKTIVRIDENRNWHGKSNATFRLFGWCFKGPSFDIVEVIGKETIKRLESDC
jgi:glutamyl-tRNA synthetase